MSMSTILLIIAFVLFLLHAFGVTARLNLQSLGLAAWVAALIFA